MNANTGTYWAKTDPATGKPALTVRDHCLIVGAVAEAVRSRLGPAAARLAPDHTSLVAALHDIGKISPGFQRKCPCVAERFASIRHAEDNHAKLGQAWLEALCKSKSLLAPDGRAPAWVLSVGAHHGRYTGTAAAELLRYFREEARAYPELEAKRMALFGELSALFGPPQAHPGERTSAATHWLTGLVTFADWIGSNTEWFPTAASPELRDAWTPEDARAAAASAVSELGWHRSAVKAGLSFGDLFEPSPDGSSLLPRPLQTALVECADGPGLYLVEAPMGMGKTEAALAAAYRRWTEGNERGLYFALPTQLTSNRIHHRLTEFLDRVVADRDSVQALVHGNAWLFPDRVRAVQPTLPGTGADATDALAWFASGRRALLAPFGTGTIDQALMSVMAAKHAALRLFALSGKAVVLDEVHSYDPYTSALVDRLVKNLLEVGCSVFVLSATLTERRRRELVAAAGADISGEMPSDYPLVTRVRTGGTVAEPIRIVGESPAPVEVILETRPPGDEETWREIAAAAESGACVLVIRNTVKSAQETYRQLKSLVRDGLGIEAGLLHSRYTFLDRQRKEREWMEKLGRDGSRRPSRGAILVATQVVEQSVDIDADLLVTDLAPVDLVIQRLGRLHRHRRDSRSSGFAKPRCRILLPQIDWSRDEKEIKAKIGPSAWVYPPFALYQAERLLAGRGRLALPGDIRPLLEASDTRPPNLPEGAGRFAESLLVEHRDMALSAARQGWLDALTLDDIEGTQTRWGSQRSGFVALLKEPPSTREGVTTITPSQGESLSMRPGQFSFPLAKALHENAVRVPFHLIRQGIGRQEQWVSDHIDNGVVAARQGDSKELQLLPDGESDPYRLLYCDEIGLRQERNEPDKLSFEQTDDSWY